MRLTALALMPATFAIMSAQCVGSTAISALQHMRRDDVVESVTAWDGPMESLPGPTAMTRYFPETDAGLARRSFALHITMIIHLIEELSLDYDERHPDHAFTDRERAALNHP